LQTALAAAVKCFTNTVTCLGSFLGALLLFITIISCAVTSLTSFFAVGLRKHLGLIALNAVTQNWVWLSLPLVFFASASVRLFCLVFIWLVRLNQLY
jgi:hypothetical protein